MKRIFLHDISVEEIIKRLNNGQVIKSTESLKYKCRLVNGVLVTTFSDKFSIIGDSIPTNIDYLYFEDKTFV